MKQVILILFVLFFICDVKAEQKDIPMGPTPEQDEIISRNNKDLIVNPRTTLPAVNPNARPFAEYEHNGYVVFSSGYNFYSQQAKMAMAKNLPKDVTLVIYTDYATTYEKTRIARDFEGLIEKERLKIIEIPTFGVNFWSRDGLPVPVVFNNSSQLRLVDAKYYHRFEPDEYIAQYFGGQLVSHEFYYEGGNFMPNSLGDCLLIERSALPTDDILKAMYGCKRIMRLPLVKGIGHADESVKFFSDKVVLTDTPEYEDTLTKAGFTVYKIPRPLNEYETYVNALMINGVVFLPVFNEPSDQDAIKAYERLGLKVVPVDSKVLSNNGQGSVHCITMNYPAVPFHELLRAFHAVELK